MKNKKPHTESETFDSLGSAAARMKIPKWKLSWAKGQGCPGFTSNRVQSGKVLAWLKQNPPPAQLATISALREQKLSEEVRRLSLANKAREGDLVARAWVVERFQRAGGELHTLRAKSEAEHPLLFASACPGADVASCRTILRGIWDEVFAMVVDMGKHFEE